MELARPARLACLCTLVGACATSRFDRAWVSTDLQARTGHAIAAAQRPPARPSIPSGVSLADGLALDEAVAIAGTVPARASCDEALERFVTRRP